MRVPSVLMVSYYAHHIISFLSSFAQINYFKFLQNQRS